MVTNARKYLLVGGYVYSNKDNNLHYVSSNDLMKLYKLDPAECILTSRVEDSKYRNITVYAGMQVLFPREDGNYNLPPPLKTGES